MINPIAGISSAETLKSIDLFVLNKQKSAIEAEAGVNKYLKESHDNSADNERKNKFIRENSNNSTAADSEKEAKVDYKELANKLKDIAGAQGVYFEFIPDEETKKMLMRVVNEETKEVIRQYPAELTLKIVKIINETLGQGQIANFKI